MDWLTQTLPHFGELFSRQLLQLWKAYIPHHSSQHAQKSQKYINFTHVVFQGFKHITSSFHLAISWIFLALCKQAILGGDSGSRLARGWGLAQSPCPKIQKCASSIKKLSLCCETTRLWMMPQGGFFVLCGVGIDGPFESSFWDASLCNAQFYSCLVMLPCTVTANRMGGIISIIVRILNMKVLSCMPQW